eukprot:6483127-Amphidinium_carterae.1
MHASEQLKGLDADDVYDNCAPEDDMQRPHPQRVRIPAYPPAQLAEFWIGAKPLSFDPSFYSSGREWNYSKGLWNKVTHFFARCFIPSPELLVPPPTVLEVLLSYLVCNGMCYLSNEVPDLSHGGWLSLQLSHM